jgi:hypothetical protein
MANEPLDDRRKALENSFFAKQEKKLLAQLREKKQAETNQQELMEVSGITDAAILATLVRLGIGAETLAALSLAPLVAVAWADGTVDDKERTTILAAAAEIGIQPHHIGYQLVETWLAHRPSRELDQAWDDYVGSLNDVLTPAERNALRDDLLSRARRVAEASGGILGLGNKVSKPEQAVLKRLAAAFD